LNRLPTHQRRVLGRIYLDQLPLGDAAAVLRVGAEEIRRQHLVALDAFLTLLGQLDEDGGE
jgi:hypothetical protein